MTNNEYTTRLSSLRDPSEMSREEYRSLVEQRFVELGRAGANHDTKHAGRKQWERLRQEIASWEAREALRIHGVDLSR